MEIKLCAFADEADKMLTGQIAALKRNGIGQIELRGVNGKNIKDLSVAEAKDAAAQLKANDIKVWSIGSPIGKTDIHCDFDAYLTEVRHIYGLAQIFECDKVRVFSFFNAYEEGALVVKYMQRLVSLAGEYGLTLYHENEKDIYGDTAERVSELLDKVVGLSSVYDPANFVQVGQDMDAAFIALFGRTSYFHIKDVIAATGQLVPAGFGDGKVDKILRVLDRSAVLTLEPHLKVFDGYATIDDSEMKNKFDYKSNDEAFDAAVSALKGLLVAAGYREVTGRGAGVWTQD